LELALQRIGTSDLQQDDRNDDVWMPLRAAGWDARVKAAKCAIMCSARSPLLGAMYLPKAMDWIEIALMAAPEHPMLRGMLSTAKKLHSGL
jgi:hypothetical protein